MDEETIRGEPLHRSIGVAALLAAVTGAVSLLVGALEGEYVGYRRASHATLAVLRDFDRVAPMPQTSSDDVASIKRDLIRGKGQLVAMTGSDFAESLRAWEAASENPDWLSYVDADLYEAARSLADEIEALANALKVDLVTTIPDDETRRSAAASIPFTIGGSFALGRDADALPEAVVSNRTLSADGKSVTFGLAVTASYGGGSAGFSFEHVTVPLEQEQLVIDFTRRSTLILAIKFRLQRAAVGGLTRMLLKSVKAKYFVLFWVTYAASVLWIAVCARVRTRRSLGIATVHLLILAALMAYEPLCYWATQFVGFGVTDIESGLADFVATVVVWIVFLAYTTYHLGLRRLWPLVRPGHGR